MSNPAPPQMTLERSYIATYTLCGAFLSAVDQRRTLPNLIATLVDEVLIYPDSNPMGLTVEVSKKNCAEDPRATDFHIKVSCPRFV